MTRGTPGLIVHLVCTANFAGTERYVLNLTRALAERTDGQFRFLVLGGDESAMRAGLKGSRVDWQPARSAPAGLRALLTLGRAELVHTHLTAADFAAVAAFGRHRAPIVSSRHIPKTRGSSPAARLASTVVSRRLAAQIAVSDYVAGIVEGHCTVIHPGVPEPTREWVGAQGRDRTVLIAQRLEAEKNTALALDSWSLSGLAERGWTLQIAGEGAQRSLLQRQALELGVQDSVAFLGQRTDLAELRGKAGILFASPPDEAYGLSVVEAMADGMPVVAAAAGGHLETLGLVAGAPLFPAHSAEAAAELLRRLADDPAERDALGLRSQQVHRSQLDADHSTEATLALYKQVLA